MNKSKENSAPLNQFYNKGTSLGRKHKRRKRATKINPKQNSDRITHISNYFKCKWIKCTNQKTGGVGTKTRAIYMLSTRDLVISNTVFQQHKRRLYTCTSSDGQHWNQIDYIFCSQRWRSSIQSAKTRPGADCGSDHELLIAKFRLKLKRVGITTIPFRYDLNRIPYDYTVEVKNRFKGLDLIDTEPDEHGQRFVTLYRRQGSRPSPWKRNAKRQNGCLRRPYK